MAFWWHPFLALSPVAGLLVNCATHLLAVWITGRGTPYRALLFGGFAGLLVTVALSNLSCFGLRLVWSDTVAYLMINTVAYLALSFNYFNFVNLCHTSLRIRILQELRDAGGVLSADRLRTLYDDKSLTRLRVKRLLDGRHLIAIEDRLISGGGTFLLVAAVFDCLRWVVLGRAADRLQPGCPRPDES